MRPRGFTLLEIMLAITIFSAAISIAVSSLLGVVGVQRKSTALQRVENNVNFALRSMMIDISVGDLYYCGSTITAELAGNIIPQSCWWPTGGGKIIVFRNVRGEKTVYRVDRNSIERCVATTAPFTACDSGSGVNYLRLTSSDVNINNITSFYVDGAEGTNLGDTKQPRAQIVISASTVVGGKQENINIQNTVTQLTPDF